MTSLSTIILKCIVIAFVIITLPLALAAGALGWTIKKVFGKQLIHFLGEKAVVKEVGQDQVDQVLGRKA